MQGPVAAYLDGGRRLHLQHGPIDLVIGADGVGLKARAQAFDAAITRFDGLLSEIVAELPALQQPFSKAVLEGSVAQRMQAAALPFAQDTFLTPMIAVAGSVADEVLDQMISTLPLRRAYVNNGGDIALFLAGTEAFSIAIAGIDGTELGRISITAESGVGGIATSGTKGRSLSMGIADSVTVLARTAAQADAAATLLGNAVDLPGHPAITRAPASEVRPDSDLGDRLVVTHVAALTPAERAMALAAGTARANAMLAQSQIVGAALFLQDDHVTIGAGVTPALEETHV